MPPDCFIFDMDGVLCSYDLPTRLSVLEDISGIPAAEIRKRLWDSGFEDRADAGAYEDGDSYLQAFGRHMGFPISRNDWIRARAQSMTPDDEMLSLVRKLSAVGHTAILTNNVPLLEETLAEAFPQAVDLFNANIYFSCSLKQAKPDPEIYRTVANLCGHPPARCLFTDDKPENADGATRAGMTGIHFTTAKSFAASLANLGVSV